MNKKLLKLFSLVLPLSILSADALQGCGQKETQQTAYTDNTTGDAESAEQELQINTQYTPVNRTKKETKKKYTKNNDTENITAENIESETINTEINTGSAYNDDDDAADDAAKTKDTQNESIKVTPSNETASDHDAGTPDTDSSNSTPPAPPAVETRTPVFAENITASREARNQIRISWNSSMDSHVETYIVKRRERTAGTVPKGTKWETIETVRAGLDESQNGYTVIDRLDTLAPKQYEYRIDTTVSDETSYMPQKSSTIYASNVMVCLDPGHYAGVNAVTGTDSYGYAEGDFTLKIAEQLASILKGTYGIDSYMTRSDGSIRLDAYADLELDQGHISLRGTYASKQDSNLFVSLHTNANDENANGYATCSQPASINKTLVILNEIAKTSDTALNICNAVGMNLSIANYRLGLSTAADFDIAAKDSIREWTITYNDSLNTPGTVVCRTGSSGDYYGVLRGAAAAGIPGIIIEHGMHTVPEVRKAALENLAEEWARADAYGIAFGFGFTSSMKMKEN